MSSVPKFFTNQTLYGRLQLRVKNKINPTLEDAFALPATRKVEVLLPGGVVLSTLNSGEITVVDANLSTIDFVSPIAKTALCATGVGAIDCVVYDTSVSPNIVTTFEKLKVIDIEKPANT